MAAKNNDWPVLKRYAGDYLARVAMPIGGIGTGTISLGGRGNLQDWEIVNRPAKGFNPRQTFFALWAKAAGQAAVVRALEGPIPSWQYEGSMGCATPNHGLPRFARAQFDAAYPLGQVHLSDPDVPLEVRLEAFNPLIPADADSSGLPIAVLRFVLINPSRRTVAASVCGSLENFIGADGSDPRAGWGGTNNYKNQLKGNRNEFRDSPHVRGLFMQSTGTDAKAEQWGTIALTSTARHVSHRRAWADYTWGDALLDFWDDFSADGKIDDRDAGKVEGPIASLAASVEIPAGSSRSITFLIAWHFPNRQTWTPIKDTPGFVGNYYATKFLDAWDVAERTAGRLAELESRTVKFVRAFVDSDFPEVVKEAALFNLSTLRTQTCFRAADGNFFGWEGCHDHDGCCPGSCTHVWNYEPATASLFGSLSRSMREIEYGHATDDRGLMNFRVHLPLARARSFGFAAADGQMGSIMRLYRDWRLSGDEEMLRRLWPGARRAMEFCWIAGGWDADQDGVMEGCQHNTMDVEYYGPNPQMQGWYLGAMLCARKMAEHLGEEDFAARLAALFDRGRAWTDEHLFNGEYYEHHIQPPAGPEAIAPGLKWQMGAGDLSNPDLQLGAGCLIDQLVGQYMAHLCGLGYLLERSNVGTTLKSLMKYNFRNNLRGHFNQMRSFALGEESAMVMATYPRGRRPARPFPYYNEVMTGFEYTAAAGMLYEGQVAAGLKMIRAVRARYDGKGRNPFNEAECGHHYARALASWAAVLALSGFQYSGVDQSMEFNFAKKPATWFWAAGNAWGTITQRPNRKGVRVALNIIEGNLLLRRLTIKGVGTIESDPGQLVGRLRRGVLLPT